MKLFVSTNVKRFVNIFNYLQSKAYPIDGFIPDVYSNLFFSYVICAHSYVESGKIPTDILLKSCSMCLMQNSISGYDFKTQPIPVLTDASKSVVSYMYAADNRGSLTFSNQDYKDLAVLVSSTYHANRSDFFTRRNVKVFLSNKFLYRKAADLAKTTIQSLVYQTFEYSEDNYPYYLEILKSKRASSVESAIRECRDHDSFTKATDKQLNMILAESVVFLRFIDIEILKLCNGEEITPSDLEKTKDRLEFYFEKAGLKVDYESFYRSRISIYCDLKQYMNPLKIFNNLNCNYYCRSFAVLIGYILNYSVPLEYVKEEKKPLKSDDRQSTYLLYIAQRSEEAILNYYNEYYRQRNDPEITSDFLFDSGDISYQDMITSWLKRF